MTDDSILLDAQDHTFAKHKLYRRYIEAWLPILVLGQFPRVLIIDGFAGPGRYKTGEEGSPLVAIRAIREHEHRDAILAKAKRIDLVFIEEEKRRVDHLQTELDRLHPMQSVHWQVRHGRFDQVFSRLLDNLEQKRELLPPALLFIDPFGPTGYPMSLLKRAAKYRGCEVLINFAYNPLNRHWISVTDPSYIDERHREVDEMFGNGAWKECLEFDDPWEKEQAVAQAYQRSLAAQGWRGTPFRMVNENNQTQYYLIYGTQHQKGMRVFKDAAWSVAQDGRFQFSDLRDDRQLGFLREVNEQAVIDDLKDKMALAFADALVPFELLEEFGNWHPMAKSSRVRTAVEGLLADGRALEVEMPLGARKRAAGTFPKGCKVRFAPAK